MIRAEIKVLAAIAVLFMAWAGAAAALPGGGVASIESARDTLPVILAHGCHFDMGPNMAPDRVNGPHYHDRQCQVVRVGPGGRGHGGPPPRQWRQQGGYGYGPPRPVCREQCRYIGPIKRCKTVCN